jgi:opacity protein-like surface antigen
MKWFQTFLCSFVFIGLAHAQPVMAGLKLGFPVTDPFSAASYLAFPPASWNNYEWGPYVEVRLPFKLSIEADALYRGYRFYAAKAPSISASTWEFPVVAKYHFLKGPIKPYVEGGLAFSHLSDIENVVVSPSHNTNFGIVLGGGVEVHALVLHISPEVRYTGYALQDFSVPGFTSNRNQVAVLVGIGF